MKSEQIKHSLSVGTKSIQSRVFDRETDEVISFIKIPIKDSGLVRCEWIELTDEEIEECFAESCTDFKLLKNGKTQGVVNIIDVGRAILRKAQEK